MNKRFHWNRSRTQAVWFGLLLLLSAVGRAQSGQLPTKELSIKPAGRAHAALLAQPASAPPQAEKLIHPRIDAPVDPKVRPEDVKPANAPTKVNIVPKAEPAHAMAAPQAAGTFTVFRNTNLASAPTASGGTIVPGNGAVRNGNVVTITTTSPHGLSGNGVQITGVADNSFNGIFTVTSVPSATTFTYSQNGPNATSGGGTVTVTLNAFTPIEPSGAANGRVVFYTTNSYAAVSGDRGQTFSYINPFNFFPPANGGFGGDQVIYYDRTRGSMFWLLQYNPDNTTNIQRLAVARSQADIINNNWLSYDFAPADFGYTTPPAGAAGFWDDFPDLSTSDNFLYMTTNVFPRILPNPANQCAGTCPTRPCPAGCASCTNVCGSVGAVVSRLPLDELVAGQVNNGRYYTDTHFGYRCTQGAHGTMYWGSHNLTSQIRIYRWDENSTTAATPDDVNHAAYLNGTMTATSPDGSNFAGVADDKILAAWVANGIIGFMWNAAQGGGFNYPHVEVVRFNESDRSLAGQGQVYDNSIAYLYPSVHPNDREDLGGTMAWGGGSSYPNALAWIADDVNGGVITPAETMSIANGSAGPCLPRVGGVCTNNRWGDYFSTRITPPYGNIWMGTGYVLTTAGTENKEPHFVWFGRERDAPPATNTIFIGSGTTSAFQDGSFAHPYKTVTAGNFSAMPGDTLLIGSGSYPELLTFKTPVKVNTLAGAVTIGK